jgi:hypothetical protein
MEWFFCFGTMLTLVRDGGKFKKRDDVDIGVFYDKYEPVYIKNFCASNGFDIVNRIIDDTTGKPLYLTIAPKSDVKMNTGTVFIDIFAWYKWEGLYWHTYDVKMEKPAKGIPRKYIFKGIPAYTLESGMVNRDNVGDSMMYAKIPLKYGTLLDYWYTHEKNGTVYHWLDPRSEVSDAKWQIEMDSCRGFKTGKLKKVNWYE